MPATSPGSLRARTAMRGRRRSVPASRFQGESVESRPSRRHATCRSLGKIQDVAGESSSVIFLLYCDAAWLHSESR